MYLSNITGNGGAIYINKDIEKVDISKSIFQNCYAIFGGAIYTEKINKLCLNNICGSQCRNKYGFEYGYFGFFSSENVTNIKYITVCYNSGGSANCKFTSNYFEHSESNYSNNIGYKELAFMIDSTANSVCKNIKICNNLGSWIGYYNYHCTNVSSSYFVYSNVSLTNVDNSLGHISSHHTIKCILNYFYIDIPASNLSVLNADDSKMYVYNSYIKCPSDKLIDSNGNIEYGSSNKRVNSVPQYILKVPELSNCGKMLNKTLRNDIICQSVLNHFRVVMASVIILM